MKNRLNTVLSILLMLSILYILNTNHHAFASPATATSGINSQAGSALDPIITKSYLEKRLVESEDALKRLMIEQSEKTGGKDVATKFIVIEVKKGSTLLFGESTEFILRAGKAVVADKTTNGISDLTDGVTKYHDMEVLKDHHMLNPRNDGRGILAKTDLFVLVKGDHKITE